MKKVLKACLSLLLAITIVFGSAMVGLVNVGLDGFFTVNANAANDLMSGTCGDELTWTLDNEGALTISGVGNMTSYSSASSVPWYSYSNIKSIVVGTGVTSIADYAFYGCTNLSSVTISDGVTSIGNYAFYNCKNLVLVTMPDSVNFIGDYAFYNCTSLTTIEIPEAVTTIGNSAFAGCTSITAIEIPEAVTTIGNSAFYNCTSLTAIEIPNGVTTIGNSAFRDCTNLTTVTILDGVTSIGDSSFRGCTSLESIIIPNSVTSLGVYSFYDCTSLSTVTISNGMTSIGDYVFYNCKSLKTVTIPDSVTSIGAYAFCCCEALSAITIPDSVTKIGRGAFTSATSLKVVEIPDSVTQVGVQAFGCCTSLTTLKIGKGVTTLTADSSSISSLTWLFVSGCTSLTEIIVDEANQTYSSIDGVLFNKDKTRLIHYPMGKKNTKYIIPDGVVTIGPGAFAECTNLETLVFSDDVSSVGAYAFYKATNLTTIEVGKCFSTIISEYQNGYVMYVEYFPFTGCENLAAINVDADNPYYSSADGVLFNKDKTVIILYPQNKADSSYNIPYGVVIVKEDAFSSCNHLEEVSVPYTVTNIKDSAFSGCGALESISFRTSGISVGASAFYGCSNLKKVSIVDIDAWLENSFEKEYSNPLVYGADLYCDDELVTEVIVSGNIDKIGEYAFCGYKKLTSITMLEGVTSIGDKAFSDCINLTYISIPGSVTSINQSAFVNTGYYNDSTHYEDGILYIGDCLIRGQRHSSDNVVIKAGTRLIADSAFSYTSITSITIPDSVINIGDYAFAYCYGLVEIAIPVGVKTIGKKAFSDCRNLEKIYWNAKCADDAGNYAAIFQNSGDSEEGIHFVTGNTVERIPANIINYNNGYCKVSKITISESVKRIGDSAFSGCDDFDELHIADISAWCSIVFELNIYGSCSSNPLAQAENLYLNGELVTKLVIPDGVTDISQYAFYHADCISEVVISDTVVNIGKNAFASCSGLEKITVGENVESMGDKVFSDCKSLTEVYWNAKSVEDFSDSSNVFYDAGINGDGMEIVFGDSVEHIPAYLLYVSRTADQPKVKNIVLGKNVKSIGFYALAVNFENTDSAEEWDNGGLYEDNQLIKVDASFVGDFTVREGTTYIVANAFEGCDGVTSVKIPASLKGIGANAFRYCENLREVYITDLAAWCNINFENAYSAPLYYNNYSSNYYNYIYLNGEELTNVVIPDGVTQISDYAFENCTNIRSVTIPEGVKTIGANAFKNCERIGKVSFPTTITKIGYAAFYGCSRVSVYIKDLSLWCNVSVSGDIFDFRYGASLYLNGEKIDDLVIPSNVTSIGSYVFKQYDFKSVTLHDGITSVGEYAFSDCKNLTSINIPRELTCIEAGTFSGCESLLSITIPDSVTSIGDAAFGRCKKLGSIVIPDGVTYIGKGAFSGCVALASINIPDGVTSISNNTFSGCLGLTSFTINGNLESIGDSAFFCCDNLASVTVLDGVKYIGESVFYSCDKLNNISIPDSVTYIGYNAFYGTAYYEDDFNWDNGVLYIDNHLIYTDRSISGEYAVRDGTITIGSYAFKNTGNLTSVIIPESVVSVGEYAFADCDNLEKVYWNVIGNDGAGSYCFADSGTAGSGIEVVFGDSVEIIPDRLFSDCYSLTNVSFGDSVKVIGNDAFHDCGSLCRVYYRDAYENWKNIDIGEGNDCLEKAMRIHVCTCDDWVIDVEATCTVSGSRRGICSACGETITEEIPATGHISSNWIIDKNATCTEEGSQHGVCDVCGVVATVAIPVTKHVFVKDEYVAPTCTETGLSSGSHCSVCNMVLVEQNVISANGHTIVIDRAITPTCTESGLTEGSHCSVCDAIIDEQEIVPAKGHVSSGWFIVVPATVYEPGVKIKECTVCYEIIETVEIPQLKPATPKVATTNEIGGVNITWNAVDGAVKYQVYRRQGGYSTWTLVGTTTGTSLLDKNVQSGIYYVYSVRAYNSAGQYSDFVSAKTQTRKFMAVPKLKGISNATNGLYITWEPVAGVTNGYRVYRRGAGSTYWTYLGTTKNTYFTDTQVKNNSGEYFRYTVIADGGYHSKFDTTGLYLRRLSNPTLTSAVSSRTGITVKWKPVNGCLGYYVYRKTANSGWVRVGVVNGANVSSFVDKSAKKGVTYTYTVRAVCGSYISYFNSGISCKDKY